MYRKNLWAASLGVIATPSTTTPCGKCPDLGSLQLNKYWWISLGTRTVTLGTLLELALPFLSCFQRRMAAQKLTAAGFFSAPTAQLWCLQTPGKTPQCVVALGGSLLLFYSVSLPPEPLSTNEEHGLVPAQDRFQPEKFRAASPPSLWFPSVCVPVGTPGYGGSHADIWKQNAVVLNPVQGIMHFTEGQPVQLELKLNLHSKPRHREGNKKDSFRKCSLDFAVHDTFLSSCTPLALRRKQQTAFNPKICDKINLVFFVVV